ncbi:hypothetical protein QBC46DRAFT_29394 [Diplogelasinospora grovesii]|uniref:Uncharacterized protein n=1 Tax=Diplogelasinospora grovesii TaxID=303347 RepID=A0AAN6NEP3_9PEZI|nr:hypothetical protein QBC46DRAFT_29394 [Diplogelasinospora grovesii]
MPSTPLLACWHFFTRLAFVRQLQMQRRWPRTCDRVKNLHPAGHQPGGLPYGKPTCSYPNPSFFTGHERANTRRVSWHLPDPVSRLVRLTLDHNQPPTTHPTCAKDGLSPTGTAPTPGKTLSSAPSSGPLATTAALTANLHSVPTGRTAIAVVVVAADGARIATKTGLNPLFRALP